MEILLFIICGLFAGLLGGMLGIGGGVITVPFLYFFFQHTRHFDLHIMQVAASTSLAVSFFISLCSALVQHSKKAILFSALKFLVPGLVMGCICGVILSFFLSSEFIRRIFGILALLLGIYFAIPRLPPLHIAHVPNRSLSFFGLGIGTLSSLLGIGGGILTFPTFLGYGMSPKTAAGTSSSTTLLSSLLGTVTYLALNWKNPELPDAFGYIDIPAFLTIGISALLITPIGVHLSHIFSTCLIKQVFGICLSLVGITMIFL